MRYVLVILLLVIAPLTTSAAPPAHTPDPALLEELQRQSETVQSVSSRFTQEKHLAMFDKVLVSSGRFFFQRPATLRWEYTEPFSTGFELQGDKGVEWDDATKEKRPFTLESSPAMAMIAKQILAWTRFDRQWLESRYEIRQLEDKPVTLELRPRGKTAREFLAHITVTFAENLRTLESLVLHETDGDFTRITFHTTEANPPAPK